MNSHQHDQTVWEVTAGTLESLAMMFLVPEEDSPMAHDNCNAYATVGFEGPVRGALVVGVSEGLMPELAANMLGVDADSATELQQVDALKELANVICGNLLPEAFGSQLVFHVSPPETVPNEKISQIYEGASPAGLARLCSDAGVIEVEFLVSGGAPSPQGQAIQGTRA